MGRRRRARRVRRRERTLSTLSAPRSLDKSISSEGNSIFVVYEPECPIHSEIPPPSSMHCCSMFTVTVGSGKVQGFGSLLKYAVTAFACGSAPDHGETRPAPLE